MVKGVRDCTAFFRVRGLFEVTPTMTLGAGSTGNWTP